MHKTFCLVVAACALMLVGCSEPRADVEGKLYTAAQIEAAQERAVREAERKAADSLAIESAKLENVKRELSLELTRLKANNEVASAELQTQYEDRAGNILAAIAAINSRAASEIDAAKAKFAAAQEDIKRQLEQRQVFAGVLDGVGQAAQASGPPGGGLLAAALGIGAWAVRGRQQKKADDAWDQAQAEQLKMLLALGGGNLAGLLKGDKGEVKS